MVAAAVAAGVAVAATAASAALQATAGGPDSPSLGGAGTADPREARARREQFDILREARAYTERGGFEQSLVTPSLYEFAGYTPEYDEASFGSAVAARQRADEAQTAFDEARVTLDSLTGANRKKALKGLKGRDRRLKRRELRKATRAARLDVRTGRKGMDTAREAASMAEASAGRITGLKAGRLGTSEDQAFEDALRKRALGAAQTGESTDPRLLRELTEEEGAIRARLQRQFGADYENTTAGQMALSSFRQRRRESLADFARKDIGLAGVALEHEGGLAANAAKRMTLALTPGRERMATGSAFGDLSARYQNFEEMLQQDRLAQYNAKVQKSQVDYAADQQRLGAITGALNTVAQGASSYGLSTMGGASSASRSTAGLSRYGPYANDYQAP